MDRLVESYRLLSEAALLKHCRLDLSRGSGPGGQKRNKTSNAVRLTHLPTNIVATASESRSLAENKLYALRRLRIKIAIELREPIDLLTFAPPAWFLTIRRQKSLQVSHRHALYTPAIGLALDLMHALAGHISGVAVNLGVSTTTIVKLLKSDPHAWAYANEVRTINGLAVLSR